MGVIGAIAQETSRIRLGTGITCPLIVCTRRSSRRRRRPRGNSWTAASSSAIVTGENLNEHILGDRWPRADERLEMFEETIEIIRKLLAGDYETYRGKRYTVEQARIYSLRDTPPPLILAAGAPDAAKLAGKLGDGFMNVQPDPEILQEYKRAGGKEPLYGKVTGVLAPSVDEAKKIAKKRAENSALGGSLSQDLALPRDFEAAAETVREDDFEGKVVLGDDPAAWKQQEAFIEFASELA